MSIRDAAEAFPHARSAGAGTNFETDWQAVTVAIGSYPPCHIALL